MNWIQGTWSIEVMIDSQIPLVLARERLSCRSRSDNPKWLQSIDHSSSSKSAVSVRVGTRVAVVTNIIFSKEPITSGWLRETRWPSLPWKNKSEISCKVEWSNNIWSGPRFTPSVVILTEPQVRFPEVGYFGTEFRQIGETKPIRPQLLVYATQTQAWLPDA